MSESDLCAISLRAKEVVYSSMSGHWFSLRGLDLSDDWLERNPVPARTAREILGR